MIDELSLARERVRRLGVSVATISAIAGLTPTETTQFLRGQRNCPAEKARRLNQAATKLENLVKQLEPFTLDYKAAIALREVLSRIDAGELMPLVLTSDTVIGSVSDKMIRWARLEEKS